MGSWWNWKAAAKGPRNRITTQSGGDCVFPHSSFNICCPWLTNYSINNQEQLKDSRCHGFWYLLLQSIRGIFCLISLIVENAWAEYPRASECGNNNDIIITVPPLWSFNWDASAWIQKWGFRSFWRCDAGGWHPECAAGHSFVELVTNSVVRRWAGGVLEYSFIHPFRSLLFIQDTLLLCLFIVWLSLSLCQWNSFEVCTCLQDILLMNLQSRFGRGKYLHMNVCGSERNAECDANRECGGGRITILVV